MSYLRNTAPQDIYWEMEWVLSACGIACAPPCQGLGNKLGAETPACFSGPGEKQH